MDFDFERTRPTDDGLRGVLEVCPLWDNLAIRLGVTIAEIGAYKSYNPHAPNVAALASLQQWRDGKNDGYPATWEFLLGKVKEEKGINVANKLRGKIRIEKNWTQDIEESEPVDSGQPSSSTPGPVSRVKNDSGKQRRSDCDPKREEPKSRLGEESVDTGLKITSVAGVPKDKRKYEHEGHSDDDSSDDQDDLFEREEQAIEGSTCVPVHKWRKCENAVVHVERRLKGLQRVLFTAFFLKDSSGSVYFATCFHNLCNEGEDRSKLKGEDFVRRLKDCTCHPFHTSDDSLDLDVTLKGVDILGDEPRPQPQMYPERDLVIFPTDMDALNEKIREQLGHIFNAGSDKAQHIMRMHFQLYAVELQPLPPSKCKFGKSVFSKELAVILGHPNGDYLTRTANLKMKKKKGERFLHSITTDKGNSGSPIFIVDMEKQEPVLYGIHSRSTSKKKYNCGYILDTSLFERQ